MLSTTEIERGRNRNIQVQSVYYWTCVGTNSNQAVFKFKMLIIILKVTTKKVTHKYTVKEIRKESVTLRSTDRKQIRGFQELRGGGGWGLSEHSGTTCYITGDSIECHRVVCFKIVTMVNFMLCIFDRKIFEWKGKKTTVDFTQKDHSKSTTRLPGTQNSILCHRSYNKHWECIHILHPRSLLSVPWIISRGFQAMVPDSK